MHWPLRPTSFSGFSSPFFSALQPDAFLFLDDARCPLALGPLCSLCPLSSGLFQCHLNKKAFPDRFPDHPLLPSLSMSSLLPSSHSSKLSACLLGPCQPLLLWHMLLLVMDMSCSPLNFWYLEQCLTWNECSVNICSTVEN